MTMDHTKVTNAQHVPDWDERDNRPGSFDILEEDGRKTFVYCCPCGCGQQIGLPIRSEEHAAPAAPAWAWNGSLTSPTLAPSIRRLDGCRWHGFLTGGEWQPCGDSGK